MDGLSCFFLKLLASFWSPTAFKRRNRSKQCHCVQFAQSALLGFCITLKLISLRIEPI